jgi:hypothetical protein
VFLDRIYFLYTEYFQIKLADGTNKSGQFLGTQRQSSPKKLMLKSVKTAPISTSISKLALFCITIKF